MYKIKYFDNDGDSVLSEESWSYDEAGDIAKDSMWEDWDYRYNYDGVEEYTMVERFYNKDDGGSYSYYEIVEE